jgi:PAS domain S-box-containing protein
VDQLINPTLFVSAYFDAFSLIVGVISLPLELGIAVKGMVRTSWVFQSCFWQGFRFTLHPFAITLYISFEVKLLNTLNDQNHLWKLLWDYNPNGLIVVDPDLYIKLVNPAFCKMFQVKPNDIVGQSAKVLLDDVEDFKKAWQQNLVIQGKFKEYPQYNLYVNQILFAIEDEGLIAAILVDVSHELEQKRQFEKLKRETIQNVNQVVDNQMKVVQEIAGLLGETTAETKVNLLKIIQILEHPYL